MTGLTLALRALDMASRSALARASVSRCSASSSSVGPKAERRASWSRRKELTVVRFLGKRGVNAGRCAPKGDDRCRVAQVVFSCYFGSFGSVLALGQIQSIGCKKTVRRNKIGVCLILCQLACATRDQWGLLSVLFPRSVARSASARGRLQSVQPRRAQSTDHTGKTSARAASLHPPPDRAA
eukprot:6625261-Prymnesium_polylepis.1